MLMRQVSGNASANAAAADASVINLQLLHPGSGGGSSGRAMVFCPFRPGSNPRMDLAFLAQNCCLSILTGRWAFTKNEL